MSKRILCAVDVDAPQEDSVVLEIAGKLARLDNAELDIVSVVPDFGNSMVGSFFEEGHHEKLVAEVKKKLRALSTAVLGDAIDRDTRHIVATGSVYQEILNTAEKAGSDLIIIGANDPDDRDSTLYPAVLSGDVGLNDGPNFANNGENAYQVVTGSGTDPTAVLDGFTITGGNADVIHSIDNGAGMYTQSGSPTVRHCTFTGNCAGSSGGGMFNGDGNTTISECVFFANVAGFGGGMQNTSASTIVVNCGYENV